MQVYFVETERNPETVVTDGVEFNSVVIINVGEIEFGGGVFPQRPPLLRFLEIRAQHFVSRLRLSAAAGAGAAVEECGIGAAIFRVRLCFVLVDVDQIDVGPEVVVFVE